MAATDTVLRWANSEPPVQSLEDQLRARPARWAVIDENLPGPVAKMRADGLRAKLGDGFSVTTMPHDDGPYGVLYEVWAAFRVEVEL